MKVDGVNYPADAVKQLGVSSANKAAEEKTSREVASKSVRNGGESVHLSERALQLQQAQKELDKLPDVRIERVNEIKEQIATGTYEINSRKIAEKIMYESLVNLIA
ncbi:MAG: flagellar biosynthesis anti-sigma factor FlgM [Nitrospirota bacterium]